MEGIVAEIRRDLLLRSPKAAIPLGCTFRLPLTTACQPLAYACQLLAAGALPGCSYYHWDFAIIRK